MELCEYAEVEKRGAGARMGGLDGDGRGECICEAMA